MDETEEGLKRRALSMGLQLKQQGLSPEVIYARLEKQGIPSDLAKQIVSDLSMEIQKNEATQEKEIKTIGFVIIGVAILAAIISAILLPDTIILPVGLLVTGGVLATMKLRK